MITTLKPLALLLALATPLLADSTVEKRQSGYATQFIIRNSCPAPVNLYIGSQFDSTLPVGGNTTKFSYIYTELFFTDANGGNPNGAGTTRAGFFDDGYYYIVKDEVGPLNTGLSIIPARTPSNGYCVSATCLQNNCTTAFNSIPARFPPVNEFSPPPTPPYYRCPELNTTYSITFCPDGGWPLKGSFRIKPGYGAVNKCLEVRGGVVANGTPVQIYDCNGTPAQEWYVGRGSTKVQLAGTNFCLDAGAVPANGVGLKIWECYDNLPAQQWYFTSDNRIALEGQGQCLDLPSGDLSNARQVQTWQCTDNDFNQVWSI
ncbi:ricin B-like lectin [Coprinellus micaceus]|uniref:Ricin B-like lectin n=1 Tax=Coprinellus micaceus TaxID=71717 RepID=A0A4Y7SGX7_COPMI|nr:ricin B-like lectin [Coprinellus micaceus]